MDLSVEIIERDVEDTAVVCGQVPHDGVGPFIGQALGEVLSLVGESGVTGPPFCRVEMPGDYFELEVGFPVAEAIEPAGRVVPSTLPGGSAATAMHVGPYEGVGQVYWAMEAWLGENGYAPAGAPWETYLDGPEVPEPRTLVAWPCTRT